MAGLDDSTGSGSRRIDWWKRSAFPVILAAAIGAVGGGPGYRALQDPREHPYTSADARRDALDAAAQTETLEAKQSAGIDRMESRMEAMETKHEARMNRMEARANRLATEIADKPPRKLLERVTRLEVMCEYLQQRAVMWAVPEPSGSEK